MAVSKGAATRPFSFFEWMVARRYLGATRSGKGVSLISIIAFGGIMLAVAVLIIVMSVMQGFRAKLLDQMLGLNGHIFVQLQGPDDDIDGLTAQIKKIPGVVNAAPLIQAPVYATTATGQEAVLVRAMRRDDLLKVKDITAPDSVVSGSFDDFGIGKSGGNRIAIGSRLAGSLGVQVGGGVTLITNGGSETAFGRIPVRSKTYIVGAIFDVDNSQYDSSIIFMPYEQALLFFHGSGVTEQIEVRVADPDRYFKYLPPIQQIAGERRITDWKRIIGPFVNALDVERAVMRFILMLIVAVAALNIITGLVMLVKDKTGDIAVLRTMGATQGAVMRVFFLSGALIGVLGTIAGVALGAVVVTYIDPIEKFLSWVFDRDLFSPDVYYFNEIPAQMQIHEIAIIVGWSLVMSFVSTLYPAWRAARLDPVEALRYE